MKKLVFFVAVLVLGVFTGVALAASPIHSIVSLTAGKLPDGGVVRCPPLPLGRFSMCDRDGGSP